MKIVLLTLLMYCLMPLAKAGEAPAPQWGGQPITQQITVPVTATVATDVPVLATKKFREGLTIRERREMGLTVRNVSRVLQELDKAGEINEETTTEEAAVMVLSVLLADNPAAFQDPAIDWEAILAFLERLIPLILQIIAIFT